MNILLTTGESMERLFNLDWQLLADSCLSLIAVLFLFGALSFFLFNPVRKMLTGRTEKIKGELDQAAADMADARALKEEYDAKLKNIQKEADDIMEQARKEAKAQADHTVEETTAKVDAMLAKAQEDIRMERENAMRQMKGDVASLAMEAAAKIIGKNSGADQDLSLYDQFIEEAGDPDDSDRR